MRPVIASLAAVLLSAPLATGAHATTCPWVSDPADDVSHGISTHVVTLPFDPPLDIVGLDVVGGTNTVVAVLRLKDLPPVSARPQYASYWLGWSAGGTDYYAYAHAPFWPINEWESAFFIGTTAVGGVTFAVDPANETLTWTVPRSSLPGLATTGTTFERPHAQTSMDATADVAHDWEATYVDGDPGCVSAA